MGRLFGFCATSLNQSALDFDGNWERIRQSLIQTPSYCRYRLGPELEVCGYSCLDHFFEAKTFEFSWRTVEKIVEYSQARPDLVIDVGAPVMHNGNAYNCRVVIRAGSILLIRPKTRLATTGLYREARWFSVWTCFDELQQYCLPASTVCISGQVNCPIGVAILRFIDCSVGIEICEELFSLPPLHTFLVAQESVEVIANGSASYYEATKLDSKRRRLCAASEACGCAYIYANMNGGDGERYVFDGTSFVFVNGCEILRTESFSLCDVQTIAGCIDLDAIQAYRTQFPKQEVTISHSGSSKFEFPKIYVDVCLCKSSNEDPANCKILHPFKKPPIDGGETPDYFIKAAVLWLWDFLSKSKASGFFLPLSGGLDSTIVLVMLYELCAALFKNASQPRIADFMLKRMNSIPQTLEALMCSLVKTAFIKGPASTDRSKDRSSKLANLFGSCHVDIEFDSVCDCAIKCISQAIGITPKFQSRGGTKKDDLMLQNLQARLRMVLSYATAQSISSKLPSEDAFLLVVGSGNLDEK